MNVPFPPSLVRRTNRRIQIALKDALAMDSFHLRVMILEKA
jgi:hypothetical protein